MSSRAAQDDYDPPAAALAFDPPAAANQPPLHLWRDERAPGAFVAWDEVSTTYFYIRTDDRFTSDGTDRYVRRAIIDKVGVSYR